jgi:hypothetical protein
MEALALLVPIFYITVFYVIFKKAGYGTLISFIYALPVIGIIGIIVLSLGKWPIEYELSELRLRNGKFAEKDVYTVFNKAAELEAHKKKVEALDLYRLLQDKASNYDICEGIETSVSTLEAQV